MATTKACELIFPMLATPAATGLVRDLTGARLRKWDCLHILDDALLIVDEIVTNAAEETPNKEIIFRMVRNVQDITMAVWDSSPRLPKPKPVVELTLEDLDLSEESFDDNGGWGLMLVTSLATTCDVTRNPKGGKWVWATMVR